MVDALESVMSATSERDASSVERKKRLERLLDDLTPAVQLRYRYFAELLVRSPIPAPALQRIMEALDAELLPPPDPILPLLLSTASQEDLLALYTATHAPSPSTERSTGEIP